MKPVIGIPLRYQKLVDNRAIVYMSERLRRTVQMAGGFVYSISPVQNLDIIHTKGNEFPEKNEAEKEDIEISLNMCDGIVEGIEYCTNDFVVGIQWHLEISYEFDENSKKLIDGFIEVCEKHSLERSV